ncbi:MAG: glycosyltransferase [Clostridia bacterium]|nr:glycosyltransferase [Clostridia bacterium]
MITVVITTYKREPDIVERAVRSVIAQTYRDWELIVIDDSPDDYAYRPAIKNMVKRYADDYRSVYHENPKSSGACYSRNVGLEMARGEYIAYLDDDDEWIPCKLEKQIEKLKDSDERAALVYCPFYSIFEDTGKKTASKIPERSGMLYEYLMKAGNFFGGMSMPLMRTECVKAVGGFDILMQSAQDMDLWLRIAKKYPVVYVNEPLVNYYHSEEQITKDPYKRIAGITRLIEKNRDYLEAHREIKWKREMDLIKYYVEAGEKKAAMKIWMKTHRICWWKIIPNTKELARILFF